MEPLSIRTATLNNAEALAGLSVQLGYEVTVADTKTRLELLLQHPDNCVFVAEVNGQIAGWIHGFYALRLETGPFTEIGGLVVHEDFRKLGIGKRLIEKVEEWTKDMNCNVLRLRTNVVRKETHRFYEHSGFTEIKEQKVYGKYL